ncbi:hypothetical protein K7X08_029299 [Anisodus acutangulus]|uniref:Uncharacterized protein n=1 Tax=Anisodus acutangulus TaxID=402998 RepID=A0A9Q1L4X7_9SOLA|nr:hypothetical protein K7X08_029299 [Anisodus acutangulus]
MNCSFISVSQAIIEAASYVPPPPSEEQVKRINKLAAIGERKWLDNKKAQSQKKAMRRSRDSYDRFQELEIGMPDFLSNIGTLLSNFPAP